MTSPTPSPVTSASTLRLAADARFRVVGGEGVLIRQSGRDVHAVNEVGTRILQLCDGTRTLEAVAMTLAEEFDVDPSVASADCLAFASDFVTKGALVRALPGEGAQP